MDPHTLTALPSSPIDFFFLFAEVVGVIVGAIAILFILGARKTFSEGKIGKALDLVLFGVIFITGSLFMTIAFSKVGATPMFFDAQLVRELQSLMTAVGTFFFIAASYAFYRIAIQYYR